MSAAVERLGIKNRTKNRINIKLFFVLVQDVRVGKAWAIFLCALNANEPPRRLILVSVGLMPLQLPGAMGSPVTPIATG
jgi:hypothetical protein